MDSDKGKKILEKIENAIELIEISEVNEGISLLKICEGRLELGLVDEPNLYMLVYHNLALCSQLIQDFEESYNYLEKTIKIAKLLEFDKQIEKIRNSRYISMLYVQQSAILSHIGDHEKAISSAKEAFNNISECFQLCVNSASNLRDLNTYNYQNYKTLEICLEYLLKKIHSVPNNCGKIIQRSSLGVLHYTDWVYSFTINDILDIKPLKYFEIRNCHTFVAEVSKDLMLEKICLLMVSCYLIATESRLSPNEETVKKAKLWHTRGLEIGSKLMPLETPLFQHIKSSYEKHYPTLLPKPKTSKSKTAAKEGRIQFGKSRTPLRPKTPGQRKIIKNLELKTERTHIKEKIQKNEKINYKTQREDNQEPEPPISEDYELKFNDKFFINSKELYGSRKEEE